MFNITLGTFMGHFRNNVLADFVSQSQCQNHEGRWLVVQIALSLYYTYYSNTICMYI